MSVSVLLITVTAEFLRFKARQLFIILLVIVALNSALTLAQVVKVILRRFLFSQYLRFQN